MEDKQQRNLRNYHHQARLLLTDRERDHLNEMLKEYQKYHNARQFVSGLRTILNTPAKLDLLREIRNLVPPSYLHEFDALAPYDHMAHPMPAHTFQESSASFFKRSPSWHAGHVRSFDTQSEDLDMSQPVGTGVRVLTVANTNREDLGFTIKGGSEQGTPISVSRVERGSEADKTGLVVGDEILEVNNISFEEIAVSSAIRVLQGSNRLRMTVQHNPALASAQTHNSHRRQSKEKTNWFDTYSRARGPPAGLNISPPGTNRDRKVVIQLDEKHRYIGFNIRGGSEFGLGIFVSKIDRGGMAEYNRIKVGDQLLTVNGTSFASIRHADAVDLIRGQKRLVLTVRSMGPENIGPENLGHTQSKSYRSPSTTPSMVGGLPSQQQQQQSPPFPNGPSLPAPKQNKEWMTRAQPPGGVQRLDGRDVRTKSPVEPARPGNQSQGGSLSGESTSTERNPPPRPPSVQSQLSVQRQWPQQPTQTQPYPQPQPQHYPQPQAKPHPKQPGGRGRDAKEKKRALGRSLSMKHPGERRLPVVRQEEQPKAKPEKVKRNKTFRELFGFKPKVKGHNRSPSKEEEEEIAAVVVREMVQHNPAEMTRKDEDYLAEVFEEELSRVDPIGQEAGAHDEDLLGGGGAVEAKEGKRHRKGKSKMTGIIASFRKTRPEGIVKKRHNPSAHPDDEFEAPPPTDRPESATSWASRKDSLGDSLSISSHGSLGKQKGAFMAGAGTQIMHVDAAQASQMPILTDTAKRLLKEDESAAVLRHIKRYHTDGDIDYLVTPLLAILDKPEKVVLLREVRGVIAPLDLAVFDSMVSRRELEARNILNAKAGSTSPKLPRDPRRPPADQPDSNQREISNNNDEEKGKVRKDQERAKRHQNELDRLKKQREEEVRQAKLGTSGRSSGDPTPYGQLGIPANQRRHGSFDTYSHGERREETQPALTTFKAPLGSSLAGSPADSSTPQGSLSKKSAKRVLINSAPQIIRTNSTGDEPSPREGDNGYGAHDEGGGMDDVFGGSGRGAQKGSGWDPYEAIPDLPYNRLGAQNGASPKIQNTDVSDRRPSGNNSQVVLTNKRDYDPPYASIKIHNVSDDVDTTDANESDRESVDSDYSLSKKSGVYRLAGSEGEDAFDEAGSPIPPKSPTKGRKLSPIPASPPTPRVEEPAPPTSPSGATAIHNLDALLMVRNGHQSSAQDGQTSNGSSSSSEDPVYARVDRVPSKTPATFLDIPDLDSASESDSNAKKVSFSDYKGSPKAPRKGILKNSFNRNERPTVPIRNPQLYVDDDDEDEPSPLKEIVRRNRGKSPVKPVARRRIDGFPGRQVFEFELMKSQSSLGLSLTGGKDYKNQPYVKVDRIYPGGAVAEDGTLTSGCVLVGVEGESLLDVSHHQAMDIIRSAYTDRSRKTMQVEFMDVL